MPSGSQEQSVARVHGDGSASLDLVVVAAAPSGEVLFSSGAERRVVGRRLADLAADYEMFHLDGRKYAASEWQLARAIASGEEIVDDEFFRVVPDGRRVMYRCSCWPLHDRRGAVVAAVAIVREVTEEKQRQDRLSYLAGLLDNTDDAIVALDADWFVTMWNRGAERMYGWTADEVVGRHTTEVAHLDISDDERAEVRRAVAERGRWRGEVVAYRKDGAPVPVELVTVALRDERGQITGFLGIHRDVAERRRAEEQRLASARQTETVLESITDAFVAVDREWRYTYVNERALRRMRSRKGVPLSREDVIGRRLWELFPDIVGTEIHRQYLLAMRERRPVEFETYFDPSGEWIEVHAYPSASGLSIYYRDVTTRKVAEADRERRARGQELIAELGQRALAGDGVASVMDQAVAAVARALDLELVGIAEVVSEDESVLRAGIGWREGTIGHATGGRGRRSLIGYTLTVGAPVVSDDAADDARFDVSSLVAPHVPETAATVVIAGRDTPFGVLLAVSMKRRSFSATDVSFLQAIANVISTAIERADSERRLVEAREAERRRIARDLHDEALQDLTDALAEATLARTAATGSEAADRLARVVPALKRAGGQVRRAVYDLGLSGEDARPFPELLADLVDLQRPLTVDSAIDVDVHDGAPTGPLGRRGTEALRVVGEALVNARRHSGAAHIRVDVSGSPDELRVDVSDDGQGLDVARQEAGAGATGVAGMRERARLIGGALDVESAPGAGTRVRLTMPLDGMRRLRAGTRLAALGRVL